MSSSSIGVPGRSPDHRRSFLQTIEREWVGSILPREEGFQKKRRRWLHVSSARTFVVEIDTETKREPLPSTAVRIDWGIFTPRYAEAGWPGCDQSPDTVISILRGPVVEYAGEEVTWTLWPSHIERLAWGNAATVELSDGYAEEVQEHLHRVVSVHVPGPSSELELYMSLLERAYTEDTVLNPTLNDHPLTILERLVEALK